MAKYVRVAEVGSISPGTGMVVQVEGRNIALFNVAGTFYATEDICCHEGGSLGEGSLTREVVTCPWHNSEFDVKTGKVLCPPATQNVRCFPVRIQGADVLIEVD